ncbi:phosphoglycerate dehydrogenase [Spongiibacter tropicus]|uniref:phosphoglycerate dehydrogenase n=1 Tax=Spongiibacter tropicus TaxID=454602 RepID=UPI003A99F7DC
MKILVTCPPMLGMKEQFVPLLESMGFEAVCPEVTQTLSVEELIELVPTVDGWIIGDDPATAEVFKAGKSGRLKAAVKWGIGVDNVDFDACRELGIPITNTPNMFGAEVADVALGYVIALARETFIIDREIREGRWPKNRGISLENKTVGVVGFGDIGSNAVKRFNACGMRSIVWDPGVKEIDPKVASLKVWPGGVEECDFIVFTCALNKHNHHMFNTSVINKCKSGMRIVNVARGPLIEQAALESALQSGLIHSAALDVFEVEPLPLDSYLRKHPLCILGSHNSSNTVDAVEKTNSRAISHLANFLGIKV